MTKRERVEKTFAFEPVDKVPFVPAIYEHKARLIGRSPSEVARSGELLVEALEKELETYDPDVLTVGLDVYNVEAEAAGCAVRYFGTEPDVPAVAGPVLDGPGGIGRKYGPQAGRRQSQADQVGGDVAGVAADRGPDGTEDQLARAGRPLEPAGDHVDDGDAADEDHGASFPGFRRNGA